MKTIIFTAVISFFLMAATHAQTLHKKEARDLLEKAWRCLVTSDSAAFARFRETDNPAEQNLAAEFNFIRQFLDTAIARNLAIHDVEIEKHNLNNTDAEYWIKTWFQYDEHYYKGFGFYVAYKTNRWVVRGSPSTSSKTKN